MRDRRAKWAKAFVVTCALLLAAACTGEPSSDDTVDADDAVDAVDGMSGADGDRARQDDVEGPVNAAGTRTPSPGSDTSAQASVTEDALENALEDALEQFVEQAEGFAGIDRKTSVLEEGLNLMEMDGNLRLLLTDAPANFDEVWVEISRIDIGAGDIDDTTWLTLSEERTVLDLLSLQNGVTAVLGDAYLKPGYYSQMRFVVENAEVVMGDERVPLNMPVDANNGIKVNLDFALEDEVDYAVVLNFGASESIRENGEEFLMLPVIKVEYIGEVEEDGIVDAIVDNTHDGAGNEDGSQE